MVLGRFAPASMAFGRASPTKMNASGTMRFDLGSVGKSIGNFFTNSFLPWVDNAVGQGLNWISPHLNDAYQGIKQDIKDGKGVGDVILNALDKGRHAAGDILDKVPGGAAFKPIASAVNNAIDAAKPGFQNKDPIEGIIQGANAAIRTPGAFEAVKGKRNLRMSNQEGPPTKKPNIDLTDPNLDLKAVLAQAKGPDVFKPDPYYKNPKDNYNYQPKPYKFQTGGNIQPRKY